MLKFEVFSLRCSQTSQKPELICIAHLATHYCRQLIIELGQQDMKAYRIVATLHLQNSSKLIPAETRIRSLMPLFYYRIRRQIVKKLNRLAHPVLLLSSFSFNRMSVKCSVASVEKWKTQDGSIKDPENPRSNFSATGGNFMMSGHILRTIYNCRETKNF